MRQGKVEIAVRHLIGIGAPDHADCLAQIGRLAAVPTDTLADDPAAFGVEHPHESQHVAQTQVQTLPGQRMYLMRRVA